MSYLENYYKEEKVGNRLIVKRQQEIEDIMRGLSLLQFYIKFSSAKLGWHHINKICEPFFSELFNKMHGLNLKVLEGKERNHPGIDLGDNSSKYSVQITSDGSKQKLKDTIIKFEEHKLFEKYDTLLHFVVGEKYFIPRKKDPYEFQKGAHNTYYANANVMIGRKQHKYQIIIQDIYDLLLFINDKESDELTQLHCYIDRNINKFIDQIKLPLYNFEPGDVQKFTANTFMTYFDIDLNARLKYKNDLENLAAVLKELPENTLRFLYFAMKTYKEESYIYKMRVNIPLLKGQLGLTNQQFQEEVEILRHANLIDESELEYGDGFLLEYFDSEGNEMMTDLYNFCKKNERSLRDLIMNVDFRQLD